MPTDVIGVGYRAPAATKSSFERSSVLGPVPQAANLIVLFADEGQEIITGAESAFADHRAAGIIREARATIALATQAYTSLHGSADSADIKPDGSYPEWFTRLRPDYAIWQWLRGKFETAS